MNAGLRLFNAKGERNVSTNHIAAQLQISPGNLYYHFANKQEIVFELFQRYRADVSHFMTVPTDRPLTFNDKIHYFEATFKSIWDYRFLHRDLGHLLSENAELHKAYRAFTKQTLASGKSVLSGLRDGGLMAISDAQLDALMINIWVVITSWTSFLQAINADQSEEYDLSESQIRRGIYQLIALTEPFAAPGLEDDVQALKNQYLSGESTDPLTLFDSDTESNC